MKQFQKLFMMCESIKNIRRYLMKKLFYDFLKLLILPRFYVFSSKKKAPSKNLTKVTMSMHSGKKYDKLLSNLVTYSLNHHSAKAK